MPTSLSGLAIFVAFLTPGFLNYLQRRRRVPQSSLSPLGRWPWKFASLTPIIVDSSGWYYLFEKEAPKGTRIYLGCDLKDSSYVGGYLDWYNTNVNDVSDRDLILGQPLTIKANGVETESSFQRIILSAREISKIRVSFV